MPRHRRHRLDSRPTHMSRVQVYWPYEWGGARYLWSWPLYYARLAAENGIASWCSVRDLVVQPLPMEPVWDDPYAGVLLHGAALDNEAVEVPIPRAWLERELRRGASVAILMALLDVTPTGQSWHHRGGCGGISR